MLTPPKVEDAALPARSDTDAVADWAPPSCDSVFGPGQDTTPEPAVPSARSGSLQAHCTSTDDRNQPADSGGRLVCPAMVGAVRSMCRSASPAAGETLPALSLTVWVVDARADPSPVIVSSAGI